MLDRAVLTVARAQIKDLLGFEETDENRAFRYQAYKQSTLWGRTASWVADRPRPSQLAVLSQ